MSLPITPLSLTRPLGFHSQESGFLPRKRWIYLLQNETSSHLSPTPTVTYRNTPPRKPKKSFFHQGNRGVGFRGWSKSWEKRKRASAVHFALHFGTSSPEPWAAPVLTRSSGDRVQLLERGARAAGTRRRGGPPAAAAGAESHHLFPPKRLRAWAEGAGERAWGGGEEEQHLLLHHTSETPRRRRHRRPLDPGTLAQPLHAPVLSAPPRASPNPSAAEWLNSCSRLRAPRRRLRHPREPERAACQHDGLYRRWSWRVTLAAPRLRELLAQLLSHLRLRAGPAPVSVTQPFPGSWRTADLQPCAPLGLIRPLGLKPRPLPGDVVAWETGALVPMTTGAVGLAFAFFGVASSGCRPPGEVLSPILG